LEFDVISNPVYLEPISEARKTEFLTLAKKSRAFHKKWSAPPSTPAKFGKYMRRIGNETYRCFYICRTADKKLVGVINVSQIFRGDLQSAYLGYYVFEPFARQGYMRCGLALVLKEAFTKIKLHRVEANIQPKNIPSKKLVKRLGFRFEGLSRKYLRVDGEWRDHEKWAMTVEDWKKASGSRRK
jgi:[ribosomal protein S5]-alanine N-acetyltransferase